MIFLQLKYYKTKYFIRHPQFWLSTDTVLKSRADRVIINLCLDDSNSDPPKVLNAQLDGRRAASHTLSIPEIVETGLLRACFDGGAAGMVTRKDILASTVGCLQAEELA